MLSPLKLDVLDVLEKDRSRRGAGTGEV